MLFISDVVICVVLGMVFLMCVFIHQMCSRIYQSYQICYQYVILKDLVSNVGLVYLPFVTGIFAFIFTISCKECVCVCMCVTE
jgi:hypothetical protein